MDFMALAAKRYSVRKFSGKKVEEDKLNLLLSAGMLAPTAKSLQPQRVYVLQSKEALQKLDSLTHCRYGAGTVLLFTYNSDEEWKNPLEAGIHSGVEDVTLAAAHIMLEATALGLGTCWCNYFANSKLEELFGLPKNEKSVLIMPVGYAADDAKPTPMHEAHKQMDEIVKFM